MALNRIWEIADRTQDSALAVAEDRTVYGAPEVNRNQEAHFVVIAKMDENQNLTFISGIDNSNPLTSISYPFTNPADGAYRIVMFNPLFWNGGTTYSGQTVDGDGNILTYSNIVWGATAGAFYRVIDAVADFSGIEPGVTVGWQNYWAVINDFTAEINNTKVDKFVADGIITFRFEDCLVDELEEVVDDILCGVCTKTDEMFKVLSMQLVLDGAKSYDWQNKQPQAEVIIVQSGKKYCC